MGDDFPHLISRHDLIDKAMCHLELRTLESIWKLLTDRLLDYTRSGKSDQSIRLCQCNIA